MRRGLFVTGTGTGVGKTVACAALFHRYGEDIRLRYWKPVQTGIEQDDDAAEVRRLSGGEAAEGMRLRHPVSPHLAAKWNGVKICLDQFQPPDGTDNSWIVEGAGGVLVPLNESDLMIDLMRRLTLAVLVVARSELGTINHTLLTLEALRARSLCIAGVLMAGIPNADNRAAIEHYGGVYVIGEMPMLQPLDWKTLGAWACTALDPEHRLLEFLR